MPYMEMPPVLTGGGAEALQRLYGYLFRMAEQMNVAQAELGGTGVQALGSGAGADSLSYGSTRDQLQALIVNTAETLRREMDRLEQVLRSEYQAVSSQWGVYKEQISATITATAEGVVQQYGFASELDALSAQATEFDRYRVSTEGFIRQGFVERNEQGVPIIGIAIGQGLTGVETTVNGQTVLELDSTQSCAFYTADRVSFRIGGREVAYLSNRRLYVEEVQVTGRLWAGKWMLDGSDGLLVKYIG